MVFEVCVDNIISVRNAFFGGADRLELCSALSEGGLTPSVGFLEAARKATSPDYPIFVMIRPRGGDFVYAIDEIDIMASDIHNLKLAGANGFVFGLLTDDKKIDVENCKRLLEAAKPLPVTFHRAYDELDQNSYNAVDVIIELGFTRLLTSGGAATAEKGADTISRLVNHCSDRLIIMPGSGVMPLNLRTILKTTRATEFHGSAKRQPISSKGIAITSQEIVREMKKIEQEIKN